MKKIFLSSSVPSKERESRYYEMADVAVIKMALSVEDAQVGTVVNHQNKNSKLIPSVL